jgi:hypothetical protein
MHFAYPSVIFDRTFIPFVPFEQRRLSGEHHNADWIKALARALDTNSAISCNSLPYRRSRGNVTLSKSARSIGEMREIARINLNAG